jgi:membrane protein YqaA with SNARE-associated domain
MIKKWYRSLSACVHHSYAAYILSALFFIEAIFFVPVDPVLVMFCVERQNRAFWYAFLATVASVLGGLTAYVIGAFLYDSFGVKIIAMCSSLDAFDRMQEWYRAYESLAVLGASFTPFPYKIVTLSAGFCKLSLAPFLVYSFIGRGVRFFLVAFVIRLFGVHVQKFIDTYLNVLFFIFLLLLLMFFVVLR